jgi:alkanesulfonate monooxygenase SsuD/methylene tetrahydromethanopterin reductase-like flavin-dependent oxidoreductase (luciferase family)
MKSLTFGLNISTSAADGADPVGDARAGEALGFDFVSASDHPSGRHPSFETWTMLTWICAATERVAVASRVLSIPFRSPALVAKMAESLDRLSEGRLILGLGAGATDKELRGFGLPVPSPREKIDGLDDALRVIRGLWTEPAFSYQGSVHKTDEAEMEPKPVRRIPIWLGTFGDRALSVTGRLADGWIPSLGYAPFDQLALMRRKVLTAAESAGRKPESLTCALNVEIAVEEQDDHRTGVIVGPVDKVTARLCELVALGFDTFNLMPNGAPLREQVELLATEVLPGVRAMA